MSREDLVTVKEGYHPLDPALYVDKAVGVHVTYITAVYPKSTVGVSADHLVGLLLIVEITEHDRRTAYADLTLLIVGELTIGVGSEYAYRSRQQRIADGLAFEVAVAAAGGGGGYLAHSVALRERIYAAALLKEVVQLCLQTEVHRVAAGACCPEKVKTEAAPHLLAVHELFIV